MKSAKCLGCYQSLKKPFPGDYHSTCSKKLFGTETPPIIDFDSAELERLAIKSLYQQVGLTGVQPKISTHIERSKDDPTHRLMIVDLWGDFILKPPTKKYPDMSIVEDVTMHMATACGLNTAKHGLIQLKSGELAYITKRFDRAKKQKKIAVEDFCQLSELLTEAKYNTSTEKAGKIIIKYSSNSGLDLIYFYDLILFSFLTGNSDMHLKNFSLMKNTSNEFILAPFYDLLATKLILPEDHEEAALTINGKKSNLKKEDFLALGRTLGIIDRVVANSFKRILMSIPAMKIILEDSFLSKALISDYSALIDLRAKILT